MKIVSPHFLVGLVLACQSGPRRTGPLSVVADSLLPRWVPQTCLHVPAQANAAYRTGYFDCASDPDSAVTIDLDEDGRVTSITVRTSHDASAAFEESLARLISVYG